MIEEFQAAERAAAADGLSFATAMRMLSAANVTGDTTGEAAASDWSRISAGPWLAKTLEGLRHPDALAPVEPGEALKATLRPNQQVGVRRLRLLTPHDLVAWLADDLGLAKTMQ